MIARFVFLLVALGFFTTSYSTLDGSRDAALYVGDGPGDFTTVQAGIDAVTSFDMPRTIYIQPKTYLEALVVQCTGKMIMIEGNGAVIASPSVDSDVAIRECAQ